MTDRAARLLFLFGREVDPEEFDDAFDDEFPDPDDDVDVLADTGVDQPWGLVRRAVATQVLDGVPPATWAAAQRLSASGLERGEVLDQLARGLFYSLADIVNRREEDQDDGGASMLTVIAEQFDRLPLPDEDDVIETLLDVASADQGIDADELGRRAVSVLGRDPDDRIAAAQARFTLAREVGDGDRLAVVTGGKVVNRERLAATVVMTHRLTADELRDDTLRLVSSDLCLFANADDPVLDDGSELEHVDVDGGLGWAGPDGWLDDRQAGELVAVRLGERADDGAQVVTLDGLGATDAAVDAGLAAALREAFDDVVGDEDTAVPIGAVVARVLIDRPDALATPQAPISELCVLVGIELRGAYAGVTPAQWRELHLQRRHERLHDVSDDDEAVHAAVELLDDLDDPDVTTDELRAVLRAIAGDADIAEIVVDELAPPDGGSDREASGLLSGGDVGDALLSAARRDDETAAARWVAAVVTEREGRVLEAESHLQAGYAADQRFEPVVDRLAWYASDRGDAAMALKLWTTLDDPPTDEIDTIKAFARPSGPRLRRNDPCWCGSGRKYKVCHQRQPEQAPLPDRVGWLCRKATSYLMRHEGDAKYAVVGNLVAFADGDEDTMFGPAVGEPLVVDAALTEGGWFARFLEARGPLLPEDERLLAASWLLVDRTVVEVVDVDPGRSIDVRDLRTGDLLTVSERSLSRNVKAGSQWCARVVPDGAGHQIVGGVFPVAIGKETAVLELCDRGDPLELCGWAGATGRPVLQTREGEEMVECTAELRVGDRAAAAAVLDGLYERRDDGWVELHELNEDESIVRATLDLDADRLRVLTHSVERMDRVLAALRTRLPDAELLSDECTRVEPGEFPKRMPGTAPGTGVGTGADLSPAQREEIVATMERRWISEPVPALGGLTPLEAAADPTRRAQLAKLIDSFPEVDGPLMTLRPSKLRETLGL